MYLCAVKEIPPIALRKQKIGENIFGIHTADAVRLAKRQLVDWNLEPGTYDSNYWLVTITLTPDLKIKGQENAYKTIVQGALGGAGGLEVDAQTAGLQKLPHIRERRKRGERVF